MATWKEDVVKAMIELGGISNYQDLNKKIEEIRIEKLPENWHSSVRHTIETHSSDSRAFRKKEDLFESIDGIGKGVWGLRNFIPTRANVDLTEDDLEFPEGREVLQKHILRERNSMLVLKAKQKFKENHGRLFCEVCGFIFEEKYGSIGKDFIEAHHIKPISEMKENEKTKITDIVMVCSNCHKMLHRKRPWISKEKLKSLLTK